MTNTKNNLPENYIQQLLETYADWLEKHKDDSKALLVELLKASDKLGKRIDSFEDYESLQATVAEMEANGNVSWLQKLGLKDLRTFIETKYPEYGQAWLANKQQTEQKTLNQKHQEERKSFFKLFPQSPETQNQCLSWAYIDDLLKTQGLHENTQTQLKSIKSLLEKHNANIDSTRLTIKNNLVCIDGYTLPTGTTIQYYKEIKDNPAGCTYPSYAKALLEFTAQLTWTTFSFPSNRDRLQKGEITWKEFDKEINTPANKAIIKTLYNIVWFDSVIPVWLDKDGYVIYAVVRSDYYGFYFYRYNDYYFSNLCLVSSA